ncbi:hypothetical protein [Nocardia sp. XZ_19_231]|uniref:hypothetical protein n=1 Tax=Nocardia sp. XZ_19_231 TaxID=2769252 RepID=UPI00188F58DF|nr:hypothetical protein [Nocardia sp. XZ_19_231]
MASRHDELGLKVQRAQHALEKIRGIGTVDGVTVEVDADSQVVAVSGPHGEKILAAYRLAVLEMQPRVTAAMRELAADPRVESTMAFIADDAVAIELPRPEPLDEEDEASIFERGW